VACGEPVEEATVVAVAATSAATSAKESALGVPTAVLHTMVLPRRALRGRKSAVISSTATALAATAAALRTRAK
jgi:hypothetical protein